MKKPKILVFDIETSPTKSWHFGMHDQNISPSQIVQPSFIMSWAAKWIDNKKVMYLGHGKKCTKNDPKMIRNIWMLLNEADILLGQNIKQFDIKKLNSAFFELGLPKPSSYKVIDILNINRGNFSFESNKLEHITSRFNNKYKKLTHKKYPGLSLWLECMAGNKDAWKEMEIYNKHDVLSTEEYYKLVQGWDTSINFNLYHDELETVCHCGGSEFQKNGFAYTSSGKFQRFKCSDCGSETRSKNNLFSKEKKKSLRVKV